MLRRTLPAVKPDNTLRPRRPGRAPRPGNALRAALSVIAALWLLCGFAARHASAQIVLGTPRSFEGTQVHPLALTPDGTRLLAVNTPNATLSVFQLAAGAPVLTAEIPVGLEPVSVAARNDREAWVVNWLSDSVSVVDLSTGVVVRTVDVGDEPTDILFAGMNGEKAFVCVSGRSQVKVFDPANLAAAPQVVEIFGKQPRALARSADGGRVFASVFESGNGTTVVSEPAVAARGGLPAPQPSMAANLPAAPNTGLIVRWNGTDWVDEINRSWNLEVPYTLADVDLVVIDASGAVPVVAARVRNLGTHVGNMAYDAATGRLFVANLESLNHVRFEPNLAGRFQHSRVAVLRDEGAAHPTFVTSVNLNPHVDFGNPAGTDAERAQSLALPADVALGPNGEIYVAATSSGRVGVIAPAGNAVLSITVGPGPTGLVVDGARRRLYVLNRFDGSLSAVDTDSRSQIAQVSLGVNPEPAAVRAGRKILFDAGRSAHGTVSCASCHLGGHRDGLAWDLGDPRGAEELVNGGPFVSRFHPMKGPMTTQSLRAITATEPLHWRGDRPNLAAFNPAFASLLGGARQLTPQETAELAAYVQSLAYPPNPNQNLDRTLTPQARRGFDAFNQRHPALTCNQCHTLLQFTSGGLSFVTGTGTNRLIIPGFALGEPQDFKVPQLRGLYQKTGMERTPGEKLTGFGFVHDGTNDTLFNFLKNPVFSFPAGQAGDQQRRDIEAFLLQLDTGTPPAVGLQVTIDAVNKADPAVVARLDLLARQASTGNSEMVARGLYGGAPRAFLRLADGTFQPDSASEAPVTLQRLIGAAGAGAELTFTGVPPGAGRRASIDRDADGLLDDDEPRASVQIAGRVVDASGQGIPGVAVTLSGSQAAAAVTDARGRYVFNYAAAAGTHTVTPQAAGQSFTPASRTFANPSWNPSADFVTSASANASDASRFFVAQHYYDFLGREPDEDGLQFWTDEIESCGADRVCREAKRVHVSAAFFLSIEFQQTGYLVYRASKASFGDAAGSPVPVNFPRLMTDTQRVGRNVVVGQAGWEQQLETNKRAFFAGWVQRPEFLARYPAGTGAADFVDALNANTGGSLNQSERDALVAQLAANNTTAGRAAALRQVAEHAGFTRGEFSRAFVLMQYFGYLRRDPDGAPDTDFTGYNFWLTKLNEFGGNFVEAEMVKAFINSLEYRRRFGQ